MRNLNYPKLASRLVDELKKIFDSTGYKKAVLGLSGGLDSAVVYALCVRALGVDNVYGIAMPVGSSSLESLDHAKMVSNKFGGRLFNIDLAPAHQEVIGALDGPCIGESEKQRKIRHGNIAARLRMITLFDLSVKFHALVVGTENLSEHNLGYFTLFGDAASCVEPIRNLYKTEVFKLARELGVPEEIINKPPTADLWQGQTDEGELGFTYADADQILYNMEMYYPTTTKLSDTTYQAVSNQVHRVAFKHEIPYVISASVVVEAEEK